MTLTLDLGIAAAAMGLCGTIAGLVMAVFKLWSRFRKLERQADYRQDDMVMIFGCLRACLEGLKAQGCNGTVTETLKALNDYTAKRASGVKARL